MALSNTEIKQIAELAYLETDANDTAKLAEEVDSIIKFVDQLQHVDTTDVKPLFHPLDAHQRLRADKVTEEDCWAELNDIAPAFDEEQRLYLVPKVIEVE